MKNFIYTILFVLISIFSVSCSKEPMNHEIKYEVVFLEIPAWYQSNSIEVTAVPNYSDDLPKINKNNTNNVTWTYDYWELQDGDEVLFTVNGQLSYHFEMRVYIDGREVSYKKIKVSDTVSLSHTTEAESGINDYRGDYATIKFVYSE